MHPPLSPEAHIFWQTLGANHHDHQELQNYFIFIEALIIFMQYGNSKLLHSASAHCMHISVLLIAYYIVLDQIVCDA